jgi:hypothetical protein
VYRAFAANWGFPKDGRAGQSGSQDQHNAIMQAVKLIKNLFARISLDWQQNMVGMDTDELQRCCVVPVGGSTTSE